MMRATRREFMGGAAAVAAMAVSGRAFANPLGLPPGIQLYSVRTQMAADLDGTLAAVAAAGYKEVESAALPKISAKEIRAALDKAGLNCVSSHHPFAELHAKFEEMVEFDITLGSKYIICSSPGFRNAPAPGATGPRTMTIDDWKYNAEQFNLLAQKTASSGITLGYHNHVHEFEPSEGTTPYATLLKEMDPKLTTLELDCGWAKVAGADPVQLMKANPHRFSMFHVKDFHLPNHPTFDTREAKVTELGRGSIDYKPVFAQAAKNQHITHAFVEQEAFDVPWKESLQIDADYLKSL